MTDPAELPVRALAELVSRIADALRAGGDQAAARTRVAAEIAQLEAIVRQVEQRAPGSPAGPAKPAGIDLAQVTGALQVFAAWLGSPTSVNEAQAERAMSDLQATLGPLIGWDPDREDAARRAQYRLEARAALDEIFRDKP